MIEQLERDSSNPAGQPQPLTVVISKGVDAAAPVVIEVVVDKDGPVSLELLTKLLIVGVVFLATRHIAPSVAIVGAILAAFIPDLVTSVVRRRRWGKKRVGILAALFTFFAALDSAFAKATGNRGRKVPRPGRAGGRRGLGLGHAMSTTAVAATIGAVAIAVPAIASGGSPFRASHTQAPVPASHARTPLPAIAAAARHTHTHRSTQARTRGSQQTPPAATSEDRFVRIGVSPTGVPGTVTLAPGQRVHFEFTLPQPSKVIFALGTGGSLGAFNIWRDSDEDGSSSIDVDPAHPFIPAGNLAAGPHTITVEATGRDGGTLRYVAYASTDRTQAAGASAAGVPGTVTVTPGQRAHLQFTLEQPSRVVFAVNGASTLTAYSIWHDAGLDGSSSIDIDASHPYIPTDLSAGPHTITIEPSGTSAGTLRFVIYASTDRTQAAGASAAGVPGTVTVTPGQRGHLQFTLKEPSRIVFAVDGATTLTAFNIWRDAGLDGSSSIDVDSTHPYTPPGLLSAGPHTITIEPTGTSAGTLAYTLYASVDVTQTLDASSGKTAGSVKVTPGQWAHLEFTLQQPSHVVLAVDPNSTLTAYNIWHDAGQDGSSSIDVDSANPYAPPGLLAAGPHTITIQPTGTSAGALLYTLTVRPG